MCTTIFRAYDSLKDISFLVVAAGWASRESFLAAATVSIPGIKPLFANMTWFKFKSSKGFGQDYPLKRSGGWSGAFKSKDEPFERANGIAWDISPAGKGERFRLMGPGIHRPEGRAGGTESGIWRWPCNQGHEAEQGFSH
ncbi:hypothetical protein DL766_008856 [Monosporascus sp. MC13-8B]|uniref:Uncharacterized protein n=1 Tax=Monosporascus cannonballus TaxID=155416 RepID=A0ABY0HE84_9PEZI|nr:hypothetical protein DL762_002635 [Monosporascus cannonballus]RYO92063.1 hypothetical protein DL763_004819 [Monosporascus cannonballus]RYP17655.1 hypothetical protein DL766_008856 [Monosporascus sp. MC13-8B]